MTNYIWTGAHGTDWAAPNNWTGGNHYPGYPGGGATTTDTVTINTGASSYPDVLSGENFIIATLTINAGGSLSIESGGSLETTGASSNTGTLTLNGGSFTDDATLTNTGTISGYGSLTATITNTGGRIEGAGGALIVAGAVTNGTLEVGSGSADALTLAGASGTTDSVSTVTFLGSAGTLTVNSGVSLTDNSVLAVGSSNLAVNGSLTDSLGVTLAGGQINGSGGVSTATPISGNGTVGINIVGSTISASGGTMYLTGLVGTSGGPAALALTDGSTLDLTNSGANYGNVTFTGSSNETFQDYTATQANVHIGTISGFSGTDVIDLQTLGVGDTITARTATSITINGTYTYNFSSGTNTAAIQLHEVLVNGTLVDQLSVCFMPGTMIRTPDGEAAIETLNVGDLVLTIEGAVKAVNWIGRQTISTLFADPIRNLPIRVKAGALAENVPARDLLISPAHALLVDSVLINAGALVNGTSIVRESRVPRVFTYYHIELDDHSLILAENAPAETFVDSSDREYFDNWAEYETLYPEGKIVDELPYPRAKSHRQVPVYIRVALADRAQAIGAAEAAVA